MRPAVTFAALALVAATGTMRLASSDLSPGGVVPRALMASACGGQNREPALEWSGVPAGVKSFAVILHDPDAPLAGGFYHWVVYDLPATARAIGPGMPPGRGRLGITSLGKRGYYGPCPPPGPAHHYVLTLYALDLAHVSVATPSGAQLESAIAGHVLGRAVLTASASHP
jgi:Raf kinase inhibitor-like YbhB/YbcL family protein